MMEKNSNNPQLVSQFNADVENTLMGNLGIKYTYVSDELIEAEMPVDERTIQPFGILHGGATLALAETVAGAGSFCICDSDQIAVGMQVSANHFSSAGIEDAYVKGVATIIHRGRTTHVWNVDVFTPSGQLVSSVRITNYIKKK